jgi:DNA polymerase-3 subunit delta'
MHDLYPWLEPHWQRLAACLQQGRFPHALLVTGLPGTGKRDFADFLSKALLCEAREAGRRPCGHCDGCQFAAAGTHPDFFNVTFAVDEKTGKLSSVIKIDQIRTLSESLALSRHGGAHKVAILQPADALNINAANSLLKTLEEPADNTVLILVSAQPGRLPATVRSRCQQLRVEAPAERDGLQWLQQRYDGPQPEVFLRLAHGAPLRALELARDNALEERRERFEALLGLREGRADVVALAQAWAKDEDLKGLHWLRGWLMDLLRVRLTGEAGMIHSIDLAERLVPLAQRLDSRVMFEQLDRLNRLLRQDNTSLNRQLMTEDVLLAWADS